MGCQCLLTQAKALSNSFQAQQGNSRSRITVGSLFRSAVLISLSNSPLQSRSHIPINRWVAHSLIHQCKNFSCDRLLQHGHLVKQKRFCLTDYNLCLPCDL